MTNFPFESVVGSQPVAHPLAPVRAARPGPVPVSVSFTFPADLTASSASVVGDFNDWDPDQGRMKRTRDGSFVCVLSIRPGRTYQYRFLLDGDRWTNDWSAQTFAPNSFGGVDSVLDLRGPEAEPGG